MLTLVLPLFFFHIWQRKRHLSISSISSTGSSRATSAAARAKSLDYEERTHHTVTADTSPTGYESRRVWRFNVAATRPVLLYVQITHLFVEPSVVDLDGS